MNRKYKKSLAESAETAEIKSAISALSALSARDYSYWRWRVFQTVGVTPSVSRNLRINCVELWKPLLAAM